MGKNELSIIVPVFNVAEYLAQCIESILAQTFMDFELILVDDGSTDTSGEICDAYQKKDERIKVIRKENGGAISARKAGLIMASGEYVGFVDGDDWIDRDMYMVLCREARRNNVDLVITDNDIWQGNRVIKIKQGVRAGLYEKEDLITELYPNLVFRDRLYNLGVSPSLCTKITRRELLLKYQFEVDECIKGGDDAACIYPCILQAEKLFYVKDFFPYHYRVHKKSMTHQKKVLNVDERMAVLVHMNNVANAFNYPDINRQMGLYGIAVIEELFVNAIKCGSGFEQGKLGMLAELIRGNVLWSKVIRLYEIERLPKQTQYIIKFIKDSDRRALRGVEFFVLKQNCKQLIKKIIYKE